MNSTEDICKVDIYEENGWMPIAFSISYGIGLTVSGSWMYSIWKDAMNSQKVWTIFSIFNAWIKSLVSELRTDYSLNRYIFSKYF